MNRQHSRNKREEELQLLQFLKTEKILEFGERPDLILQFAGQRIAIEHTRVIRDRTEKGSPERQRESIEDQIVGKAKALYLAEKHYSFHVDVLFSKNVPISQKQIVSIAQKLCDCIRELESTVVSGFLGPFDWRSNQSLENKIPQQIEAFWIERASEGTDFWLISEGGVIGALEPEFIQLALDDKERKMSGYRKKCDRVWIVIAAAGSKMSSYFDIGRVTFLENSYKSSADAVHLLDCFSDTVHELHIEPAK